MTGGVLPEAIPPDGSSTEDSEDVDLANGLIIDINTATVNELAAALPGIGPGKAQRIVEWREANGPFQSVEQLLEVSGIGPKTLEKIRPFVRIGNEVSVHGLRNTVDAGEVAFIEALETVISQAVRARADSTEKVFTP
jgi:competence ComEA-like helix-hairpin-helix protein